MSTARGKSEIGLYLARNIRQVDLSWPVTVNIDSEMIIEGCSCQNSEQQSKCECTTKYAVPISCNFGNCKEITKLSHIQQRKGEAEMAQIDWLFEVLPSLEADEAIVSIVTSGDIDAIPLHMYAIARSWPRHTDGSFLHDIYVLLQKPKGKLDLYDVTAIVSLIEMAHDDTCIAMRYHLLSASEAMISSLNILRFHTQIS